MQFNINSENCPNCIKKTANYTLGTTILTLGIGILAFLCSLLWANFINKQIEQIINKEEEMKLRLYFALVMTLLSILIIFLLLYYLPGEKC